MNPIPSNVRELYDLLRQTPDLCGCLSLETENILRWDLWEGYRLSISLNYREAYVALEAAGRFPWQLTHWHTDSDDILEELRSLGTRGSLLILRRGWFGEKTMFFAPGEEVPKRALRRGLLRKPLILKAQ